jgi:predicted GNAT superfamily acetyltransferase
MAITYRFAESTTDLAAVGKLETEIWGLSDLDIVPVSVLRTILFSGGCVILAEYDGDLVGFCVGLPARLPEGLGIWSYIAGVRQDLQGNAIGKTLKFMQRDWAAKHGFIGLAWTFDPLQVRNANFNLNHLGAVARRYHKNVYGEMQDAINRGLPSDRLEVWWDLSKSPAITASVHPPHPNSIHLIEQQNERPLLIELRDDCNSALIPIPNMAIREQPALAKQWQAAICEQCIQAFSRGYVADAVVKVNTQAFYQLTR